MLRKIKLGSIGLLVVMMCLNTIACGAVKDSTITSSEETNNPTNTELFEHFDGNLSSVEYFTFDESKTVFTNEQALSIIQDTLNSCTYEEIDSNDYNEGFYSINLVFDDRIEPLGIDISTIAVGGKQYRTIDGDLSAIISIINSGSMNYISSYFIDSHEHESMKDGYTVKCDLNNDGKEESITIEDLHCNGGDGAYFPHVYNEDGDELIYQQDKENSPFTEKWNEGNVEFYYDGNRFFSLDKETVYDIYLESATDDEIGKNLYGTNEMTTDLASGFVVVDNNGEQELIVKYYTSGTMPHVVPLGYCVLHLKLTNDEKWEITPEFVRDKEYLPNETVELTESETGSASDELYYIIDDDENTVDDNTTEETITYIP